MADAREAETDSLQGRIVRPGDSRTASGADENRASAEILVELSESGRRVAKAGQQTFSQEKSSITTSEFTY